MRAEVESIDRSMRSFALFKDTAGPLQSGLTSVDKNCTIGLFRDGEARRDGKYRNLVRLRRREG
jgi:hypothetical protein